MHIENISPDDRWLLLRVAEAAAPEGTHLPPVDGATIERALQLVADRASSIHTWLTLARLLDRAAIPLRGAPLSALPLSPRIEALDALFRASLTNGLARVVTAPLQIARAESPPLGRAIGLAPPAPFIVGSERRVGDANRVDLRSLDAHQEIEADVVVVGTGAGGAPIAALLAERGHAVVVLEEGGDFSRRDFVGAAVDRQARLYRDHGLTYTVGNTIIPLPLGKTVGGTTTINSGTCYRTPADVQRRWVLEHGLDALGPGSLDPYFERVERELEVAPCPPHIVGEMGAIIARGAGALGFAHGPLDRNAPGCDAQATCCFGCPTDAKRSTNVSYVPRALARGATLFHHARVQRVLGERGVAVGVEARSTDEGERELRRLVVRAKAVVLACGAIHTPLLLLEGGLANGSGEVGKNLTIHPAGYAFARMPEPVRGWRAVPQSYAIEEFAGLGIRFEGAYPPPPIAAAALGAIGHGFTERLESLDRMAFFGFMLRDTGRGRVLRGGDGRALIRYDLAREDVRRAVFAQAALARVFFAAGAKEVLPGMTRFRALRGLEDVARLEREGPETIRAHHLALSAYHPLGTCRMGRDASRSVIGQDHMCHDVPGLFVTDGSAVPGPLGVNPQVTIMALSERAATFVERRVERRVEARAERAPRRRERRSISFSETMRGTLRDVRTSRVSEARFSVHATSETSITEAWSSRGVVLELEGTIDLDERLRERPCRGTLTMRPTAARATLIYDLSFEDDDGARLHLRGEKHARFFLGLGMTRLFTEIWRDGELEREGVLRFALGDFPSWLASFRLGPRDESARALLAHR